MTKVYFLILISIILHFPNRSLNWNSGLKQDILSWWPNKCATNPVRRANEICDRTIPYCTCTSQQVGPAWAIKNQNHHLIIAVAEGKWQNVNPSFAIFGQRQRPAWQKWAGWSDVRSWDSPSYEWTLSCEVRTEDLLYPPTVLKGLHLCVSSCRRR